MLYHGYSIEALRQINCNYFTSLDTAGKTTHLMTIQAVRLLERSHLRHFRILRPCQLRVFRPRRPLRSE